MKNKIYIGSIAVVFAALLWSLDGFLRRELYSLPPAVVVFWEHLLGLIILAPRLGGLLPRFQNILCAELRRCRLLSRDLGLPRFLPLYLSDLKDTRKF